MPYSKEKGRFDIVKKYTYPLIAILLTTLSLQVFSATLDYESDLLPDQYRLNRVAFADGDSSESKKLGAFFNGFSVGASAGVGLFHGSLADYDIFAPMDDFDKYYRFAWRVNVEREIKWGLGAKLQFEKGKLSGGRLPGKQSLPVDFEAHYNTVGLVATYNILDLLTKKDGLENHKIFLNAEIGVGVTLYRSLSYWRAPDGRVRDYVGYTVTDENPPTQRYTADKKTAPAVAFNVPVGFTFRYRVNYKTDLTFSYTLNNLSTDRLDTWDRDFSAQDKYSYFGLGVRYNFNREKSQYPKKKIKEEKTPKAEDEKWKLFGSKKEDVQPNSVNLEEPIASRQSGKIDQTQQSEELEEVKLKMFELQLKLFEMQYLLNGGDPAKQ